MEEEPGGDFNLIKKNQPNKGELFQRYRDNPVVTAENWPYPVNAVFNPGAARLPSGETVLLATVENRSGASFINVIRSSDGFTNWLIDEEPAIISEPLKFPEEMWGIGDPRVVYVPEMGQYAVTYTSFSESGSHVSLALTKDFMVFDKLGKITQTQDKNACIFPRKIGGRWLLIHQPVCAHQAGMYNEADICLSYSDDLLMWEGTTSLLKARLGSWWDANKIGLSTPPVETPCGWLIFYHGIRNTAAGCLYRVGAALLDLENPAKVISRGDEWILGPKAFYELVGNVNNVVFPCGFTVDENSDEIRLYYGAADSSIAVATGNISRILDWLEKLSRSIAS